MRELDAIVLGAGPAALSTALKLSRLGRTTAIVTVTSPPRPLQLETVPHLSLLGSAFSPHCLEGVIDSGCTGISWWAGEEKLGAPVFVVDRSILDGALLAFVRASSVDIYTVDTAGLVVKHDRSWMVRAGAVQLRSRFLVDATGRNSIYSRRQPLLPWEQMCITAELMSADELPRLWTEPLPQGWLWCARGPGNRGMSALFTDQLAADADVQGIFMEAIRGSRIAGRLGPIARLSLRNVTPSATAAIFENDRVALGDAALCKDPLGSQGLSVAVSDGQAVAIAIHTILADPGSESTVIAFLEQRHRAAVRRHRNFLIDSYSGTPFSTPYWQARTLGAAVGSRPLPVMPVSPESLLTRSEKWWFGQRPVLLGDKIELATCLCSEEESVRWLFGFRIEALIPFSGDIVTARILMDDWQRLGMVSANIASRIMNWLVQNEVLCPVTCYP